MEMQRRYDIDWLRVLAIGLLLVYHVAIAFQSWGIMIGFITSPKPWPALWPVMGLLNVWRIPLLFFVSGMGVYLAMQQRTWKQLLVERSRRILLPYVFGALVIVPLGMMLWRSYNNFSISYDINPGHLWFLGNIFVYVLLLLPLFFFLKRHASSTWACLFRRMLATPWGLMTVMAVNVAEAVLVRPVPYEMYAMTAHGFFLGLEAFFFGFCFMYCGEPFWRMMLRWRWMFLFLSVALYVLRAFYFEFRAPLALVAVESDCWIFAVLSFGHRYLNRPGKVLRYLSEAAYPVYIVHIGVMFAVSWAVFALDVGVELQFVLVLVLTLAGCLGVFEVIRRSGPLRILFGMKIQNSKVRIQNWRVGNRENPIPPK